MRCDRSALITLSRIRANAWQKPWWFPDHYNAPRTRPLGERTRHDNCIPHNFCGSGARLANWVPPAHALEPLLAMATGSGNFKSGSNWFRTTGVGDGYRQRPCCHNWRCIGVGLLNSHRTLSTCCDMTNDAMSTPLHSYQKIDTNRSFVWRS